MPLNGDTLYAKWTINNYTISFDENGGATKTDITQAYQSSVANPGGTSRTGYSFQGWYYSETNNNGSGTAVSWPITMPLNGDILYAKWDPISYNVCFDANGGSGNMLCQPFTYDSAQNLIPNNFTRTGYTFAGWATSAGGSVVYTNEQNVTNLTTSSTITLYAK